MPRDDLTYYDGFSTRRQHLAMAPNDKMLDQQDAASAAEEFIYRSHNLPHEIATLQAECAEKDRHIQILMDGIIQRDNHIQKFIKLNRSTTENPKEPVMRKWVLDAYDKIDLLQEESIALATKIRLTLDRQTRGLDEQIQSLISRNELTVDEGFPSLLRPEGDQAAEKLKTLNRVANNESRNAATALSQSVAAARAMQQSSLPRTQPQSTSIQAGSTVGTPQPGSPAAALLLQQRQREASAGLPSKRQRLTGGLGTLPANPSNLARHSSVTPGTPKASTPTGERAGSVGPRPQKSAANKKTAPHQQKSLAKKKGASSVPAGANPKSSLNRVKKPGRNTPNSTNDSELSEAESLMSIDDEEAVTPPVGIVAGGGGETMELDEDDAADNRKYCTCQRISFGDMVACDNDNCPREWFHWPCVGLKAEPDGAWFCPDCTAEREKEKAGKKKSMKL